LGLSHVFETVAIKATKLDKCSAVAEMGDRLAKIDMAENWEEGAVPPLGEGAVPPLEEGAGSPCNTMQPGPRPTFVPSGILIHPAV